MGGEIKIIKKNGPGTLMRMYLLLNAPVDGREPNYLLDYAKDSITVRVIFQSLHVHYNYYKGSGASKQELRR